MQKQKAINIPNPVSPLMKTVKIMARGMTTFAFSISSAIVSSALLVLLVLSCIVFTHMCRGIDTVERIHERDSSN